MKKKIKKSLSVIMIVVLCLTMAPLQGLVGLDISSWFASEAEAAGLQLDDDDYIATHEYFVNSEQYYYMMENGCLYNNVDGDFLSDAISAGTIWGLVGDMGKLLTLQFSNSSLLKMVSSNPFDLILADLLISYTGGDTFNSASTATAYDFYNKSYETLMNMLKSTSEWEDSYEETLSFEIKGILRDPNYDFSDSNAYSIFEKCLGELFEEGTIISIFDGLDCASKISEVLSTAANIVDGFLEAYHAYSAALAFLNVSEYFAHSIRMAETHMDSVAAILLEVALSNYEENINSDEDAFNFALEQFRNSTAKTLWGIVESIFTQSNTKFMAKVIGASPAEFGILTFAYNTTYQLLDCILKHSDTTNLAILTYAASLFEDGLSFSTEDIANSLRVNPCIENAQFFDCSWGMLQCVEQYGYKTAAEFSLSKNLGTRIIKFFNKAHTNNDMEVAASWQSAWRGAGCHNTVIRASKDVLVQCPVDIELYDSEDNLLFVINDDIVDNDYKDTFVEIYGGDKKFFSIPCDTDCKVVIRSRENGEMSYKVFENNNFSTSRVVEYNDIQLVTGKVFECDIPSQINVSANSYNLITDGEVVEYDYDSLPPIEDNIVDVIVAEELFDGFSVEIIDLVADAMFNMKSVVDLSVYDISTDDAVALFSAVAKYYPAEYSLIVNSDFTYKIIVSPNLDRIMKIRFYYGDDANLSAYQKRVKDLNAEINALVERVAGMNEFEKALYIHDYIVLNSEYDLELLDYMEKNNFILPGELRSEKYTEYSILVNGTGVCGSYALAYRAILNAAGMECLYLSSSQMNHAWNLVKIDGNWYHVDCCWDDPTPDTYGRARRTYFLRTDDEIMNLNHYSWTPGQYKATSELFSDMPRNYDTKQKYDDGKWYYLSGTSLYEADIYGNDETLLTSVSASSIDADGGSIYYSSGRYIYEYVTDTQETNLAYMLSSNDAGSKPADAYFYNIYVDGNTVEFYKTIYDVENNRITVHDNDDLQKEKFASVTGITISQSEVTLDVFETLQLTAGIVTTGSADGMEVEWISSDESIVQIDKNGKITAANVGSATVTAQLYNFVASCDINVTGDGLAGMCGDNVRWTFDVDDRTLTLAGSGKMKNFTSFNNVPWLDFTNSINSVLITGSVSNIGAYSFSSCRFLTEITIPDSVTNIGSHAFFACTSIANITIPNSVSGIDSYAFASCASLASLTIPSSVTDIGKHAFSSCTALERIIVDEDNTNYCSDENGVLFNKDKTKLIKYPIGNARTSYVIPDSVTSIEIYAFANGTSLTSVIIGDSVTNIGVCAFEHCASLISITIGNSVTSIDPSAFRDCTALKTVFIGNSVTSIEFSAFYNCTSLISIAIPDSVTSIGMYAFKHCESLTSVTFGENSQLTNIDSSAFSNCKSLISITIPDGVTSIGDDAFEYCESLTSVTIPDSVTSIGDLAFFSCDSLTHIGYYGSEEKFSEISISLGNNCLLDAPYIHYNFDPDTDIITLEAKAATCTEDGRTESRYCIDCQCYLEGEVIEATGHDYTLTERVAGTCTAAPYEVYTCSACGDSYIKEGKIEDGHKLAVEVIAPTCTEKGYTKEVCTVCGETMISEFTSPLGHSYIITHSADYCEAHGSITYECKNCDYTETVASDPENLVTETVVVEPTCTKSGTKSEICTLCGATVSTEITSPLSHEYAEEFTIDLETTCTTEGRKSQHCTRCDVKRAVTTIEATGHQNTGIINAADATCTNNGYTGDTYCSDCKTVIATGESLSKLSHHYVTVVTEPTCTSKGFTTHTCTACGDSYTDTETAMISHSYSSVVTPVTCTLNGYTTHTCIVCSHSYTSDTVMSTGHNYNDNGICVGCGKNRTENCSHMCHKSGFMGVIWKIVRFFWKLFKMNPVCECGIAHY